MCAAYERRDRQTDMDESLKCHLLLLKQEESLINTHYSEKAIIPHVTAS
jgi:hypothetical protein